MGIFKRMIREGNTEAIEATEYKEAYRDLGERMEMKSYISFEDVRKHLVEMIEENKKLREENERLRKEGYERSDRYRKTAELAQISADEYKSQLGEAKKKTERLEQELQESDEKLEKMEREKNKAITELEMMKAKVAPPDQNKEATERTPKRKKPATEVREEDKEE